MVNVNSMPCANCIYFKKVKQPDGTEKTEYIACEKSKNDNASELLYIKNKKAHCDYWEGE